jgi:tetratricopeptide (TPR) repeat protein
VSNQPSAPVIHRLYAQFLTSENVAAFIKAVSERYTYGTLARLAEYGPPISRRASVLALGYLAGYEANQVLGRALCDEDRGVRLLAENGLRSIWLRAGTPEVRRQLQALVRMNNSDQHAEAYELASRLIDSAPYVAEAWNQRAISSYHLRDYQGSVDDCREALEINPYHFPAALGMANCYLELQDAYAALEGFRRALRICPDLDGVQEQVDFLVRSLEEL